VKRSGGFAAAHGGQALPDRGRDLEIHGEAAPRRRGYASVRERQRAGKPEAFRNVLRRSREEQEAGSSGR